MIFQERKEALLNSLKSNKNKYKRLSLSPIRYAGGKSLAVGHIIEKLPNIKRLISPFFGGGSVEIVIAQKLGIKVIGSDIDKPLANYWDLQLNKPEQLYRSLKKINPDRDTYYKIMAICRDWRAKKKKLTNLQLATYFFFNHALSYGPSFIGWPSKVYLNEKRYKKLIDKVRHFKADIKIHNWSFEKLFKKYPNDLFYCDPPYFLKEDCPTSKMFNGVYPERNKPFYHNNFNHDLLRDCLKNHKGEFILSYNNCNKARDYYREYELVYPNWQYTMGQGETRISKTLGNRNLLKQNAYIKKSHEILAIKI
ncbi:MAG: DNA adenine methylase [Bdellovibrionales bacterium]|nr:DNA adenine methylase [Bdellovibrionales bacterium]